MTDEKKKLAYLIMRVRASSPDIFDALEGEWFDNAEGVMHAFVENSSDAWDQHTAAQRAMRLDDNFLEQWEPGDDCLRH